MKNTCVQCHRELEGFVATTDEVLKGIKFTVCNYPDCPNYALMCISQEQMPKEYVKVPEDTFANLRRTGDLPGEIEEIIK